MFLVATSEGFVKKDKVGHQPGGTDLSSHSSPLEIPGGGEQKKKSKEMIHGTMISCIVHESERRGRC